MTGPDRRTLLEEHSAADCLVYGIGNVGRQDDGLGWAFVDWLEGTGRAGTAELLRGYQLQLEDADLVTRFRRVLFVDATRDPEVSTFAILQPEPAFDVPFTSHALTVPTVLATSRLCFGRLPEVRVLALRGFSWELTEGLTQQARRSLSAAQAAVTDPHSNPADHAQATAPTHGAPR
jgi:hydrogenase maturation protease